MFGDQDTAFEIERLAEIFLPEQHCFRVGNRCEFVIQNHLIELRSMLVHILILTRRPTVTNPLIYARRATS